MTVVYNCLPPADPTTRIPRRRGPAQGLAAVVAAAERSGVRRLVHLSTTQVYGAPIEVPFNEATQPRPAGPLGRLARRDEDWLIRRTGPINVVIVRAAQLFGPGEPISSALQADVLARRLRLPRRGWSSRSFIHVADAARAMASAGERGRPRTTYLASGFVSSWHALCEELAAERGVPGRVGYLPYGPTWLVALVRWLATGPGQRCWPTPEVVDLLAQGHLVDDSVSRRHLTWSPQICSFGEAAPIMSVPVPEVAVPAVTAVAPAPARLR